MGVQVQARGGGLLVSPGPGLGCVCVSQHALTQTSPFNSRRLLLRAVRILLKCILVEFIVSVLYTNIGIAYFLGYYYATASFRDPMPIVKETNL